MRLRFTLPLAIMATTVSLGLPTFAAAKTAAPNASIEALVAIADPIEGKQQAMLCIACHNVDEGSGNKIGPSLWNILNREIAAEPSFNYSTTLNAKQGVWSYQQLDSFLSDPAGFAPGTKMTLPGISDRNTRAYIISYLRTLSHTKAPLATVPANATTLSLQKTDAFGDDWPVGEGRDLAGYTCNACHSLAIVKQQGQTHEGWDELIDWMIDEQGMAELSAQDRKTVVNYLGDHFGIEKTP